MTVTVVMSMRVRVRMAALDDTVRCVEQVQCSSAYVVVSAHCEHTEQIHSKTERANKKQLTSVHFWRIQSVVASGPDMEFHPSTGRRTGAGSPRRR